MTAIREFLALTPGNPMNPVTLILVIFFGLAAIIFPVVMLAAGVGVGGAILIELIIIPTAALCIGLVVYMARRFDENRKRLIGGEHWAHWRFAAGERDRFIVQEQTRSRRDARRYLLYSLILALIGAGAVGYQTDDTKGVAIGFAVFGAAGLLVVLTTLRWGKATPREDATDLDDIYLGELGIYQMGRYTPVKGPNIFLTGVELIADQPAAIRFDISSRSQYGIRTNEVRVAVPTGKEAEAAAVVDRFRELVKG